MRRNVAGELVSVAALSSFDTRIPFSPSLTRTFRGLRCCEKIRRGRCNGSPHDQPPPRPNPRLEPTPGSDRSDYRETGHNVQTVARQQPSNGSRLNVKRPPIARIHIYIPDSSNTEFLLEYRYQINQILRKPKKRFVLPTPRTNK